MALELVPASSEHVARISRVAYRSFYGIATRHGFPPDFSSAESTMPVYDLLVARQDYTGVVAIFNGKPVGSNFLMHSDTVGSIGPLSVDPSSQSHGIGRLLMTSLLNQAILRRIDDIRLLQDTYNASSLALYASLGFKVRETVALMRTTPTQSQDGTVRLMLEKDLPIIEQLSKAYYGVSRRNEVLNEMNYGFQTYIRERDGRATGYLMPGLIGHGAYETVEDALALLGQTSRQVTPHFRKFLCPLSEHKLFEASLKAGWRIEKLLNYMTLETYTPPTGVWTPSACY